VDIGRVPNVCATASVRSTYDWFTQDIDVVVSEGLYDELDPEEIKETIVRADDRYFLEPSRQRRATHQILYCRLPGWKTERRHVKVDILVPPTLGLPNIPESEAVLFNGIPVMPIFDLLVMKTQGWWDHRSSRRADFRLKESDDVSDVFALLERAAEEDVSYRDGAYIHSEEFMDRALTLATEFVSVYGRHRLWRVLKFPVWK
jgi:hypothetical protein